jgi:DNA modification methylase
MFDQAQIAETFSPEERLVVFPGGCLEFLKAIPNGMFQLIVTSPPYNLGKEYEKRIHLDDYVRQQRGRKASTCENPWRNWLVFPS